MSEIFYDNGTVFFTLETGGLPESPYWTNFIRIGRDAERVETDGNGNWVFADVDDKIMALQMHDPLTDDGTPKESVLNWLRTTLPESGIVFFLDTLKEAKTHMADSEA
jgi:hypothetical protein